MKKGKVYLIGTGPMSEKMITLRGIECIKEADVILYDRLINISVLKYARPEAKTIFVGKTRESKVSQSIINKLLVNNAKRGNVVARLKGGDPLLLGRGGEEAEVLKKAGIDFEIVNGVSSSFAVPSYAGIPLTFRDVSSAVTIITGQEDPFKKESSIDWDRIYSPKHTLVILMGMMNLKNIVKRLLARDISPLTPVAVIQEGTTVYQKIVIGNLKNIVDRVKREKLVPPCVIVVGEVVKLRDRLHWVKERVLPLKDRNVLVISTRESFYKIKSLLEERGARVFYLEVVKILPLINYQRLDDAIKKIKQYHWLVFTSRNAVAFFMKRFKGLGRDLRDLHSLKIAVIGPQTAEELNAFFIKADLISKKFSSQGLINSFRKIDVSGKKILLLRANKSTPDLFPGLEKMGAKVRNVAVYRIKRTKPTFSSIKNVLSQRIDAVVFTSSENVRSFFNLVDKTKLKGIAKRGKIICLGEPTQKTLASYGFPSFIPKEYTLSGLVKTTVNIYPDAQYPTCQGGDGA